MQPGSKCRVAVGMAFALFAVGLFLSPIRGEYFGSLGVALWIYVMGFYVLKDQAYPFALPTRLICAFLILLITLFLTCFPWLFFGGKEACNNFDPVMKTETGTSFEEMWTFTIIRIVSSWLLAVLAMHMSAADHPESTYIRQSVRCVLFFWIGNAVRCIDATMRACIGSDHDKDGVRDDPYWDYALIRMSIAFGLGTGFLGDIWCIQLVIERLLAFEEAFGESLPCMKAIRYLAFTMKVCMFCVAFATILPNPAALVVTTFTTFVLLWLVVLVYWAYLLPLRALRDASKVDAKDAAMGNQLLKETRFAMQVIFAAQVGFVAAGVSMATFFTFFGLLDVSLDPVVSNGYLYSALADSLGNALCIALLSATSMSMPRICCPKEKIRMQEDSSATQPATCTCGQQLGKTLSQVSQPVSDVRAESACEACAWEMKVAELANRRVSVGQLLTFYTQLGSCSNMASQTATRFMPHFLPEKSTTNDVVRHAVIPASRRGDTGLALADTWQAVGDVASSNFFSTVLTQNRAPRMLS